MIVLPEINHYLKSMAPIPDPVLEEMEKLGDRRKFPIIGPLVGRLLVSLVHFGHVHTVLECGSGFGYSAAWLAYALPENGRITCIELDHENIELGKDFLERAGLLPKVTFIQGDALEVLPTLSQSYDFILNDVHKTQYPAILPLLLKRLRDGGMLLTDNVLWQGKVARPAEDELTAAIQKYNQMLIDEKSLWTTFLSIRDGVSLSIKLRT